MGSVLKLNRADLHLNGNVSESSASLQLVLFFIFQLWDHFNRRNVPYSVSVSVLMGNLIVESVNGA